MEDGTIWKIEELEILCLPIPQTNKPYGNYLDGLQIFQVIYQLHLIHIEVLTPKELVMPTFHANKDVCAEPDTFSWKTGTLF